MTNNKTQNKTIKTPILKILKYVIGTPILFIFFIFGLLQLSPIQTFLAKKGSDYLSNRSGHKISLDKIHVKWFDITEINGLTVKDLNDSILIYSKSISIDYTFSSLLKKDTIILDHVTLLEPNVNLSWYQDNVLNMIHFSKSFRQKKKNRKKPHIPPFKIRSAKIINGHFSYTDPRKSKMNEKGRFDHNYFDIDSLYSLTSNFYLHKDTISITTINLKARESKINFHIENLATQFQYCKKSMQFVKANIKTRKSYISDYVRFEYKNTSFFSRFIDSINLIAHLDSTFIHTQELKKFAPVLKKYNDLWGITGNFKGTISKFRSKNCSVTFGKKSKINSSRLAISGLPLIKESNIRADLTHSKVTHNDIEQYLSDPSLANQFKEKIGTAYFDGFFHGFPNSFVSLGNFKTDLGKFKTNIQFEYKQDYKNKAKYEGVISTEDFDLGKLMDYPIVGRINMKGEIKGIGLSKDNANITIKGDVFSLGFNRYVYKSIKVNGKVEKNKFDGNLTINDTNVQLSIDGDLDMDTERFNLKGNINHLALKQLGFSNKAINISSQIDWNFKGLEVDTVTGIANFRNCVVKTDNDSLTLEAFNLSSFKEGKIRNFKINSSLFDFDALGDFKFKYIITDIKSDLNEYKTSLLKLKNHSFKRSNKKYKIVYNSNLHNIQPILNIFYPEISISKNTSLSGSYSIDSNSNFQFNSTDIKYIRFKEYEFFENSIDISTSLVPGTDNILGQHIISSAKQSINGNKLTENLRAEIYWNNDSITFNNFLKQHNKTNKINLLGNILFRGDTAKILLSNSDIQLANKVWQFNNNINIGLLNNNWEFDNLTLANDKESITINGIFSNTKEASLVLNTTNFQLKNISQFTKVKFDGLLNGKTKISSKKGITKSISSAEVKDFKMLNSTIGDFKGDFIYDSENNLFSTNSILVKDELKVGKIHGYYKTNDTISPIDMIIKTDNAPLNILEPFLFGHARKIEGFVSGKIKIKGTLKDPDFKGLLNIKDGKTTIDYLNTRYKFDGNAYFDDDRIYVKNLILTDTLWNTQASINGGIYHKMFKKFNVDTKIRLDNTFCLNTQSKDNDLYYGQAFISGNINLNGPLNNFKIQSEELTSNKGTKISIPLEGTESVSTKNFITFVKHDEPEESSLIKSDSISLKGLIVDVNLNITKDAYMEIIFDKKAGDIIKGYGDGQINLNINTLGDFLMKGQYAIQRGTYNFTLVNLFDKRFKISPNSTITWNGDPYKGELDIKASYTQLASLKPIADTLLYDLNRGEFQRKYPVQVDLNLTGEILRPDVSFNMKINETPASIEDLVHGFHSSLANNLQELNKQVFSLIVLKQLAPEESIIGGVGAGSSVSELFSNQFSNWVSQFDENLNIQIDLEGSDFRVQFDYSLLDGKLRITQNNNFRNENSTNSLANVFGEWTLEYILTKNGKLKLKGYNKTDQNSLSSGTGVNNTTNTLYGVSLSYSTSFNKFSEIFKIKAKSKAIKPEKVNLKLNDNIK